MLNASLQMRTQRFREVTWLAQGHTAGKQRQREFKPRLSDSDHSGDQGVKCCGNTSGGVPGHFPGIKSPKSDRWVKG